MFWDSSALVPVLVSEESSPELERLLNDDPSATIWWSTPVECSSAIHRRHRDKTINLEDRDRATGLLLEVLPEFDVIPAVEAVKEHAMKLLEKHPLRAADALQLAAAIVWCEGRTEDHDFVCLDKRQRESAEREGFRILPTQMK